MKFGLEVLGHVDCCPRRHGLFKPRTEKKTMKMKLITAAMFGLFAASAAHAEEYVCKVYCNGGATTVVVQASSSSDAAKKIDPAPVANQVCREAGLGNASSSTMGSSQCSRK